MKPEPKNIWERLGHFVPRHQQAEYTKFVAYGNAHKPSDDLAQILFALGFLTEICGRVPERIEQEADAIKKLAVELQVLLDAKRGEFAAVLKTGVGETVQLQAAETKAIKDLLNQTRILMSSQEEAYKEREKVTAAAIEKAANILYEKTMQLGVRIDHADQKIKIAGEEAQKIRRVANISGVFFGCFIAMAFELLLVMSLGVGGNVVLLQHIGKAAFGLDNYDVNRFLQLAIFAPVIFVFLCILFDRVKEAHENDNDRS